MRNSLLLNTYYPSIFPSCSSTLWDNSKNDIKQNTIYFSGIVLSLENGKEVRTLKNYSNLMTTTIMKRFSGILKIWKQEKVIKKETQLKKNPRTLPGKVPFKEHPAH